MDAKQLYQAGKLNEAISAATEDVKRNPTDPTIFMSWGAVLYVQGPPPEVREEIDRENAKQARENGGR